jgi:hypothetical protein
MRHRGSIRFLAMDAETGERQGDVGELALAEVTLGELVADFLTVFPDSKQPSEHGTTRQVTKLLRRVVDGEQASMFPDEFTDWLDRVEVACQARNDIIHAKAEDRCVECGRATRYRRDGAPLDRSPRRVQELTEIIDALTREGMGFAHVVSDRVNRAAVSVARSEASRTGKPQTPKQVLIGAHTYLCGTCTGTGSGQAIISGVAAVAVLPPGTDLEALFAPRRRTNDRP